MFVTRTLFCFSLLFLTVPGVNGQGLIERIDSVKSRAAQKIDSLITVREARKEKKYDTAYIHRPKENWTLRVRLNGSHWKMRSVHHDGPSSVLKSDMKYTVSLGVGYRGVMVGLSLNPSKMFNKNSDVEYSVASYGNRIGGEMFYHCSEDFKATTTLNGIEYDTSSAVDRVSMFSASGYYVFNSRRFSYPAAFCQSYIQRCSAGSWMLGLDIFYADAHIRPIEEVGIDDTKIKMFMLGIGGGYGYNFVLPHDWLVHVSAVPTIVVGQYNTMTIDYRKELLHYKFPELMTTGRVAVVHSFSKYFTGLSAIFQFNDIGNHRDLFMDNLKWKARAFVGIRL